LAPRLSAIFGLPSLKALGQLYAQMLWHWPRLCRWAFGSL
jgi:hypothetical protein